MGEFQELSPWGPTPLNPGSLLREVGGGGAGHSTISWTNPNVAKQQTTAVICNCHTFQGILAKLADPLWTVTYMRQAWGNSQFQPLGKADGDTDSE